MQIVRRATWIGNIVAYVQQNPLVYIIGVVGLQVLFHFYNCWFGKHVHILCLVIFRLSIEEQIFLSGGGAMTPWLPSKRPLLRPPQQIWPFY